MIINENVKPSLSGRHLKTKHPEHKDKHLYFFKDMFKAIQYSIQFFQHFTTLTKYY